MKKHREFRRKLLFLIKQCACLRFPEPHSDYFPSTETPVKVERKHFKKIKTYFRARLNLKRFDMVKLGQAYGLLSDEYSREMFLRLIIIKLFPQARQIFPRYWGDHLNKTAKYRQLIVKPDCFDIVSNGHPVSYSLFDITSIGYPIQMYYSVHDTIIDFVLEQYRYKDIVMVQDGDCVINGGACYGNTALYLAHKAGQSGKVYAFEFMEDNIDIFLKNMEMNPDLMERIQLVQRPLGASSDETLYACASGPATILYPQKNDACNREYQSISVDDFAASGDVGKVHFIKFDIEGSELAALMGAKNTIKKFKPKLAICIYHRREDLWQIPLYIKELVPEYNIYVDHFTVSDQESVLFAIVNDKDDSNAIG